VNVAAVLFDLDGTLLDTAPDLGGALNLLLRRYEKPELPLSHSRPLVSMGARGMLEIGFGLKPGDADFETMKTEYLAIYQENLFRDTRLFDGMEDVLVHLEGCDIPWGIVTNKHSRFTLPLLAALSLDRRARCIVSGDSVVRVKPHPDGLRAAAAEINMTPSPEILYIGDDERDVQAAHAANMTPVVARYGYLGNGNPPELWGARHHIDTPADLIELFGIH
jgi:N-acetyl-D-muramate 6-phosphate phosphatase